MLSAHPADFFILLISLVFIALILTFILLFIQVLLLSIRALKKYLQS
jgi:hypothetical protein